MSLYTSEFCFTTIPLFVTILEEALGLVALIFITDIAATILLRSSSKFEGKVLLPSCSNSLVVKEFKFTIL